MRPTYDSCYIIRNTIGFIYNTSNLVTITIDYIFQGKRQQKSFEALSIEPLLNSIEREKILHIIINKGCRSGHCALCRTKLISGNVFVPSEVTIREVDKDYGFIHPCISYPITDVHLDLTMI